MKLILIRHGETEWVRQGLYQGSTDVPLNRRGFAQARAIALAIKKEKPIAVYSSKLTRARETAKLVARFSRKQLVEDKRLNEISFGDWEGQSHERIRIQFPKASSKWYRQVSWSSQPPGGESLTSVKKRIAEFLDDLLKKYSDHTGTCFVVTHGGPIRMFLIYLLKLNPQIFWSIRIDVASVTMMTIDTYRKELALLNSQAHLNGFKRDY